MSETTTLCPWCRSNDRATRWHVVAEGGGAVTCGHDWHSAAPSSAASETREECDPARLFDDDDALGDLFAAYEEAARRKPSNRKSAEVQGRWLNDMGEAEDAIIRYIADRFAATRTVVEGPTA